MKLRLFIILIFAVQIAFGQTDNQDVVTSDIDNFWNTYDKITATKDTAQQYEYLNKLFIEKGSPGLKAIMELRQYTAKSYIDAINNYPLFWNSIRANTLKAKDVAKDSVEGMNKVKEIYPEWKPAKIYFTVGALQTGGTTLEDKVLIGVEVAFGDKNTDTSEINARFKNLRPNFDRNSFERFGLLGAHEYVHTQQIWETGDTLLAQTVKEGVAEFVSVTATGKPSRSPAISFGKDNDTKIKAKFISQIFNFFPGFWLYDDSDNEFKTRDLGYYVGYAICEKYYEKATDKKRAIKEMIELDFNDDIQIAKFIDKSGYFDKSFQALKKQYDTSRPTVVGIKPFKNGSQNVNPGIKQITIEFSEPLVKTNTNFNMGILGQSNLLRVIKVVGFSEDGKTITFEVNMKPNRRYQLVIGEGFRTTNEIRLKPYLIDFKTR